MVVGTDSCKCSRAEVKGELQYSTVQYSTVFSNTQLLEKYRCKYGTVGSAVMLRFCQGCKFSIVVSTVQLYVRQTLHCRGLILSTLQL
jgi:hypothetical protein